MGHRQGGQLRLGRTVGVCEVKHSSELIGGWDWIGGLQSGFGVMVPPCIHMEMF